MAHVFAQNDECQDPDHLFFRAYYSHRELGDLPAARELYTQLLSEFPNSTYADRARKLLATLPVSPVIAPVAEAKRADGPLEIDSVAALLAIDLDAQTQRCMKESMQIQTDLAPTLDDYLRLDRANSKWAFLLALKPIADDARARDKALSDLRRRRDTYADVGNVEMADKIAIQIAEMEAQAGSSGLYRNGVKLAVGDGRWHCLFFIDFGSANPQDIKNQLTGQRGNLEHQILGLDEKIAGSPRNADHLQAQRELAKYFHRAVKDLIAHLDANDLPGAQKIADSMWNSVCAPSIRPKPLGSPISARAANSNKSQGTALKRQVLLGNYALSQAGFDTNVSLLDSGALKYSEVPEARGEWMFDEVRQVLSIDFGFGSGSQEFTVTQASDGTGFWLSDGQSQVRLKRR